MKTHILTAALAALFLAGCDSPERDAPATQAPNTASGGASAGVSSTAPAGDKVEIPAPPPGAGSGEAKPDPGDANDHSLPQDQHDAKSKKNGD